MHRSRSLARLLVVVCVLALPFAAGPARAQGTFPDKPLRIIIPFPPGGALDTVGRIVGQKLSGAIGQPVVIDNRAGGGGSIGAEAAARAAPDGYTLFVGSASTHGTNPNVMKSLGYDPVRDFAPVVLLASNPFILIANPALPARNAAELVALAKQDPSKLNFASYGSGSSNHLATELFRAISGADVVHVPYKGAAPALSDLMSGQVQFMFDAFTNFASHIRAGKLKALGVGSLRRYAALPDVPLLTDSGVPGYEAGTWFAIFVPSATPRPTVEYLNREIGRALAAPDVRERLEALGMEVGGGTPAELAARVDRELKKWATLIRERNIRFEQ
jgi:tripartite-type tricarboxylate transporter receptor subunit TctC